MIINSLRYNIMGVINMYKKLFNIKFNNKIFTIFIDKIGRKTFLELYKGKYIYLTIEDFTYLNKVYNDINYELGSPKFEFKEKIRVKAATLALVSLLNMVGCSKTKVEIKDNTVTIVEDYNANIKTSNDDIYEIERQEETIRIKTIEELDEIIDIKNVSVDVIKLLIDSKDIPDKLKKAAHTALNIMLERVPDIDLRIFYLNLLELKYEEIPKEELQATQNIDGKFNYMTKTIISHPDVCLNTLIHEMNHTFYSFSYKKDNITYIRHAYLGTSLIEAMTEAQTTKEIRKGTYQEERYVLNTLLSLTEYSMADYYNKGIDYLIRKLQDEYPDVDVEYLVYSLDARKDSRLNKIEVIEAPINIMDELFIMCKLKASTDPQNAYKYFANFAIAVKNTCSELDMLNYLDKYNDYLDSINIHTITREDFINYHNKFNSFDTFLVIKGQDPIIINKKIYKDNKIEYNTIDKDGNSLTKEITINNNDCTSLFFYKDTWEIVFKYSNYLNTDEFWSRVAKEEKIVSPHLYQKIPIKIGDKSITTDYVNELSLKIGITENNEIGFLLYKGNTLLYSTNKDYINVTNNTRLDYYLPISLNIDELDLNKYFKIDYLKEKEKKYSRNFYNLKLVDDSYIITPNYKVTTNIKNQIITENIRKCYITAIEDGYNENLCYAHIYLGPNLLSILVIDKNLLSEGTIYLEEILEYKNMLNDNEYNYNISVDDLTELFLDYIYERENLMPSLA